MASLDTCRVISTGEIPEWLTEGAAVNHSTFGTGIVSSVGEYRGLPSVWIDFDYGERTGLSLGHGLRISARTGGGDDELLARRTCGAMSVTPPSGAQCGRSEVL